MAATEFLHCVCLAFRNVRTFPANLSSCLTHKILLASRAAKETQAKDSSKQSIHGCWGDHSCLPARLGLRLNWMHIARICGYLWRMCCMTVMSEVVQWSSGPVVNDLLVMRPHVLVMTGSCSVQDNVSQDVSED